MGYTNLYLVPRDPEFMPSADARERASAYVGAWLEEAYMQGPPDFKQSEHARFYGSVPESLVCPACKATLDLYDEDLDEWAYEFRDQLWGSTDARNEVFAMPCCQANVAARDLPLVSDAKWSESRYARFAIYAHDAADNAFSPDVLKELEAMLGCALFQFTESGT